MDGKVSSYRSFLLSALYPVCHSIWAMLCPPINARNIGNTSPLTNAVVRP